MLANHNRMIFGNSNYILNLFDDLFSVAPDSSSCDVCNWVVDYIVNDLQDLAVLLLDFIEGKVDRCVDLLLFIFISGGHIVLNTLQGIVGFVKCHLGFEAEVSWKFFSTFLLG